MINKQYVMSVADADKFKELKVSSLYKSYINNVVTSPILLNIANEHVKNIDITDDIEHILSKKNMTPKQLNKLFKETVKITAVNMVADTLIVKDIIDVSYADSVEDLTSNFKVQYLLGKADEAYYLKAEKIIETNTDVNGLIYRGYMAYVALKEKNLIRNSDLSILTNDVDNKTTDVKKKDAKSSKSAKSSKNKKDISVDDIDF